MRRRAHRSPARSRAHDLDRIGDRLILFIRRDTDMDTNALMTAVTTVGFPIVAYGAMFWYMVKLQESHKSEMDTLRKALDENTSAITQLKELVKMWITGGHDKDE